MIVPINGVNFSQIEPVRIDEEILLAKESSNDNLIAAFNSAGQKIGYISSKSSSNHKVCRIIGQTDFIGKVWCIAKNQILIQLD